MKNLLQCALLIAFSICSTQLYAQQIAVINTQELIMLMPETTEMQNNLTALQTDLQSTSETMQVEWNTKLTDYQNNVATMTESARSLKEKDLQDLRTRISEFEQNAMQELQLRQEQLLSPIVTKAREAITAVAAEQSIAIVMDMSSGSVIYNDPAQTLDLMPAVKTKLGIAQ